MRLDDILLRDAAKRGDPHASLKIAERYFKGGPSFPRNYKLGLAYLQEEMLKGNPAAHKLVGDLVPLEVILSQRVRSVLTDAAERGSRPAMLKLGIILCLEADSREVGETWLRRSELAAYPFPASRFDDPKEAADFLRALPPYLAEGRELAYWGAKAALDHSDVARACYFCAMAAALAPIGPLFAELVSHTVQLAVTLGVTPDLPPELIETSLEAQSTAGELEAQYVLGCAYAGRPHGRLPSNLFTRSKNLERATTLLLRAADRGKHQAWLDLAEIVSNHRGSAFSKGTARFFLEKAALAGVLQAQTRLGAALLREANTLETAEAGLKWLGQAADCGCNSSIELLKTLVLPLPELSPEYESETIRKVAALDQELGIRVSLARSLHLTRREAMSFNAARDIRPWGLLVPGASYENPKGRLAPAVSVQMRTELQRAADYFAGTSQLQHSLLVQRSRAQRHIFKSLSISESRFFASEIGRSLSHYGYGRHWAYRSAPILERVLGDARVSEIHIASL